MRNPGISLATIRSLVIERGEHIDIKPSALRDILSDPPRHLEVIGQRVALGLEAKRELIVVFKSGSKAHINNIQTRKVGEISHQRLDLSGQFVDTKTRRRELSEHPTVKPVAMIADAIRDASPKGELVFHPFSGSGSTLIAAHSVRRRAALMELDPRYVDVILRRFWRMTGQQPTLDDGRPFDTVRSYRLSGTFVSPESSNGPSKKRGQYEVGYGKPPTESQWKTGQSGNPKDRAP